MTYRRKPITGWDPSLDSDQFRQGRSVPNVFGTIEGTELMAVVAYTKTCGVVELARALKTHQSAMTRRVANLERRGLLQVRHRRPAFAYLNRHHPCAAEIEELALVIANHWLNRPAVAQHQMRRPLAATSVIADPSTIFGVKGRTRVLAALSVLGEVPITQLANVLGLRRYSVQEILNVLKTCGLTTDRTDGYHNLVRLDETFFAAAQLGKTLKAITRHDSSYRSLARLVKRVAGKVVFVR